MTLAFLALFVAGAAAFVWGLVSVSKTRAAWTAQSVAGVAHVVECKRNDADDIKNVDAYVVTVRFDDTRGNSHVADLPAAERLAPGEPIAIRFDPERPSAVYRSEHFKGVDMPAALIVFGTLLMLISFAYAQD